jgi:hypothetical protein
MTEMVFNMVGARGDAPLIIDTGASCCITPHKSDFIPSSYKSSQVQIKDLSGTNSVTGEGMLLWKVLDRYGREVIIKIKGYHVPKASVRLLSPQSLFKAVGGHGSQDVEMYRCHLANGVELLAPLHVDDAEPRPVHVKNGVV